MVKQHTKPGAVSLHKAQDGTSAAKPSRLWSLLRNTPPLVVMFIAVWLWAAFFYGPVLRVAREFSFWAPDDTVMYFMQGRTWGGLWIAGRALLMLYRWPVLGGLLTALMVTLTTHLLGYCLRLRGWWKLLQYLPALLYLGLTAYAGFDLFFQAEPGIFMGVPALCTLVTAVTALIIRSFSRKPFPWLWQPERWADDVSPRKRNALTATMLAAALLPVVAATLVTQTLRRDVRVVTRMQCELLTLEQTGEATDYMQHWANMQDIARSNTSLSTRTIAAYYAMATVMRGEQGSRMFDIRMEYDDPWMHGFSKGSLSSLLPSAEEMNDSIANKSTVLRKIASGVGSASNNYYTPECDYHAGLVQTAIHHAMEEMTMNGPTLRTLKLLTKCALLKGEREVARKYLRILREVPFEGDFVRKYSAMAEHPEKADEDLEFKTVRLTEPVRNGFENVFVQPVFLGYNAALTEGKSVNALWNSLTVQIYTKNMPNFIDRVMSLQNTTLPESYAQALCIYGVKHPEVVKHFPGAEMETVPFNAFVQDIKGHVKDENGKDIRKEEAYGLFRKYHKELGGRGYYPLYYYFGNLKATKKKPTTSAPSQGGVN